MAFVTVKNAQTMPKATKERQRASSLGQAVGGSVWNKKTNDGRPKAKLSIVAAFQVKNKLTKFTHVMLKFNEKTRVLAVQFLKAAQEGSYSIERDASGTAMLNLTGTLQAFGLRLSKHLYNQTYVFNKRNGDMLVDLSDDEVLTDIVQIKRRRDPKTGHLLPFTKADNAKRIETV